MPEQTDGPQGTPSGLGHHLFNVFFASFGFVALHRFRWPKWTVVLLVAGLLFVDLAFWGANLPKIPHGGWFPLVVAAAQTGAPMAADAPWEIDARGEFDPFEDGEYI